MTERYLEDFAIGQAFGSGKIRIDKERAKAFAAEFDPQPFHLGGDGAQHDLPWAGRERLAHRRRDNAPAG